MFCILHQMNTKAPISRGRSAEVWVCRVQRDTLAIRHSAVGIGTGVVVVVGDVDVVLVIAPPLPRDPWRSVQDLYEFTVATDTHEHFCQSESVGLCSADRYHLLIKGN